MAKKQFGFLNSYDSLIPVIKEVIGFINTNLPESAPVSEVLFNAKVIVTELLTNSLKHSGSNHTSIDVNISKKNVVITKTDHGRPLSLVGSAPGGRIPITNDILHTLYAVKKAKGQLHFFYEENNLDDIVAIDDIVEHFGLLIITKAAGKFTYAYEAPTSTNIFKVILNY